MPDVSELRAQLKKLEDVIRLKLPEVATLISLSAKAFAERNIKERGFGAVYSANPLPSWFFLGKELNKTGETFILGRIKQKQETTWGEFRAAQGLPNEHVDLTYSGTMWASMQPQEPFESNGVFYAPLAGGNRQTQDEMNWNFERYGDFVGKALTPENFKALLQAAYDELIQIIDESGIKLIR